VQIMRQANHHDIGALRERRSIIRVRPGSQFRGPGCEFRLEATQAF
jgi:hypothetical protein